MSSFGSIYLNRLCFLLCLGRVIPFPLVDTVVGALQYLSQMLYGDGNWPLVHSDEFPSGLSITFMVFNFDESSFEST